MTAYPPLHDNDEIAHRRKRAVRTAQVIGGIALVIYIGFILMGVFAQ